MVVIKRDVIIARRVNCIYTKYIISDIRSIFLFTSKYTEVLEVRSFIPIINDSKLKKKILYEFENLVRIDQGEDRSRVLLRFNEFSLIKNALFTIIRSISPIISKVFRDSRMIDRKLNVNPTIVTVI